MIEGPVEYIVIAFPGNQFNGEIVPALKELVDNGTVRILDLVFVHKDQDGSMTVVEASETAAMLEDLGYEVQELLSEEDIQLLGAEMSDNSSAALIVWENTWAARFAVAVRNAHGVVVDNVRVPHSVVKAAVEYVSAESQ